MCLFEYCYNDFKLCTRELFGWFAVETNTEEDVDTYCITVGDVQTNTVDLETNTEDVKKVTAIDVETKTSYGADDINITAVETIDTTEDVDTVHTIADVETNRLPSPEYVRRKSYLYE